MRIIVTGSAGFIGGNLTSCLLNSDHEVIGIDNYSDYYSKDMKNERVKHLNLGNNLIKADISNVSEIMPIFESFQPDIVINLAAQGGVRASKNNPLPYLQSNQIGFLNIIEACKRYKVRKLIFASSSSVYGDSKKFPLSEDDELITPKSIYALSKISNELIAKHYPTNQLQIFGLRFFTVYGPWGRPDMAVFRLIAAGLMERPFKLTANIELKRDFTFVDDVSDQLDIDDVAVPDIPPPPKLFVISQIPVDAVTDCFTDVLYVVSVNDTLS